MEEWTVEASSFRSRGKNTPFQGRRLRGRVIMTVCRGQVVTECSQMAGFTRVTQTIEFTPPGGLLGKMASLIRGVEDFVIEDGEVKGKT